MEMQHIKKMRDKVEEKQSEEKLIKQQTPSSPPSAASSPAHEFSFTISLHPPPPSTSTTHDLSPADEIFFHGHLLPLHLLSHLPVSPRSSTNSLDSFTLPISDLFVDNRNPNEDMIISNNNNDIDNAIYHEIIRETETQARPKSKSFSLFGKWRKGCEYIEKDQEREERNKKKLKFDVSHVLKRMVRPLLSFRGGERSNSSSLNKQFHRQPYSFSGSLSSRAKQGFRGRRGEFSAPASTRTSPTNSGLLLATGALQTSTNDSTMEELQAAIQAAIAHCKKSIAMEEKIKCHD